MTKTIVEVKFDLNQQPIKTRVRNATQAAKIALKLQIAKDCNSNAPLKHNYLRASALRTAALNTDTIVWSVPYAHFQHKGLVMVGEHSGSPWAHRGERKVYTSRPLTYTNGGKEWVPLTFQQRAKAWERLAKELFRKGYK